MSEELLINITPQETRVAVVENGALQDVYIERERCLGIVGNIYKGRVVRVLPGMEAAFVDIGLQRTAFLHVSDIACNAGRKGEGEKRTINELLHESQTLLVQVIKDPLGSKGARLTTHLTIPSRYLVFMPGECNVGISSKIEGDVERNRLKSMLKEYRQEQQGGYIIRTAAEGAEEGALLRDVDFLDKLWTVIQERVKSVEKGALVHADLPLKLRTLRDMFGGSIERIRVDSRESYQQMKVFAEEFLPEILDRLDHYPGERPLFDIYNVEDEIQKALGRKVQLKSGGYLIFDQTEAMTTVDVNTGAFVGHRTLEETIFKTNLEAAQAIARQLRLRNLGGIIIIDFIDMLREEHKKQVLWALEKCLEKDHVKTQVCDVSALGLVEMTRKRTRESLEHVLCEPCPECKGSGSVKSPESICYEIFREILREARQFDAKEMMVLASQDVVDMLLDEESNSLAELEDFIGISTRLQVEALYTQEQYDIVLL
ncbi:MAG: ribonuclease G [Gammaproteobacteria bacterium]|nr:ribonuclease G [Gammaproteobacteria bacterium]